jgi:hypothetical protein
MDGCQNLVKTSNPTKCYLGVIQQHLMTNVQGAKKKGIEKIVSIKISTYY